MDIHLLAGITRSTTEPRGPSLNISIKYMKRCNTWYISTPKVCLFDRSGGNCSTHVIVSESRRRVALSSIFLCDCLCTWSFRFSLPRILLCFRICMPVLMIAHRGVEFAIVCNGQALPIYKRTIEDDVTVSGYIASVEGQVSF